jgi:hypothetical protein
VTEGDACPLAAVKFGSDGWRVGSHVKKVPASSNTVTPGPSVVSTYLAALVPLTNVQREVFREQFTPPQCDENGGRLDAGAVLADALKWIPSIGDTLTRNPLLVRRYSGIRFAWFLECIRELSERLDIQDTLKGEGGMPSPRSERAQQTAKRMRDDLLLAVSVLAEGDDDERARLAAASGSAATQEALIASLHAMTRLADDWLERDSHTARVLVASVNLTVADVEAASAVAHALSHDSSEQGNLPTVNRIAGRVVLEMGLAMRVFERAHRWEERVPLLVPGHGV